MAFRATVPARDYCLTAHDIEAQDKEAARRLHEALRKEFDNATVLEEPKEQQARMAGLQVSDDEDTKMSKIETRFRLKWQQEGQQEASQLEPTNVDEEE